MIGVVEILPPGADGPQHLLIPESGPPRQPYTTPGDISCTLPPLIMSGLSGHSFQTTSNKQAPNFLGMPSPPSSDYSSRSCSVQKQSPVSHDSTVAVRQGQQTPPHSGSSTWASQDTYPSMSSQNPADQATYDLSFGPLAFRSSARHRVSQQSAFDISGYGSPAMPAPSSLLGNQIAQAPDYAASKAMSTYPSLYLPPITPVAQDFPPSPYGHVFQSSTGSFFLPAPGSSPWQPPPYTHPPYATAQPWASASQTFRSARPTTILGSLPQEAWQRVFHYLDYADRLKLQRVNRFWAESLKALDRRIKEKPSDAEYADMHCLVLQAENYRKHWSSSAAAESKSPAGKTKNNSRNARTRSEASVDLDETSQGRKDSSSLVGNIGCYHCFTVRGPEFFAMKIDDEDETWQEDGEDKDVGSSRPPTQASTHSAPRRYCLDCGIKKGYHPPGKYLETKAGNNHIVWICCDGYHEYGLRNCPKCGRGCPLTPVNKSSRNSRKRASPMPPPPTPLPRRQRTTESPHRQSMGYQQTHQHGQW